MIVTYPKNFTSLLEKVSEYIGLSFINMSFFQLNEIDHNFKKNVEQFSQDVY